MIVHHPDAILRVFCPVDLLVYVPEKYRTDHVQVKKSNDPLSDSH